MTGYDREWTTKVGPRSRVRIGYSHDGGRVVRFVVQLEYRLQGDWVEVVRADHDEIGPGHDVSIEGVHVDVYRDGTKLRPVAVFPSLPPGLAFTLAEEHIVENAERYVERFEKWHGTYRRDR